MTRQLLWCAMGVTACPLAAQPWNDSAAVALATRAIERRGLAIADSSLQTYAARARGLITFRADLGVGTAVTTRVLKADQVQVEVYWQRPDRSKQIIRSWRDSTLFPTDVSYHRDHLGIVTDDFGSRIRIGDGDEVRDVIHPLAPTGLSRYDYRLGDTLVISTSGGRLVLVGLEVRPKDMKGSAVVGRVYLDRDRLEVVRSDFSFTPASYVDPELEDIAVRLERALFDGRYWLPFRQVIEIRRRVSVVQVPIRTVIRGEWWIGDHEINPVLPALQWDGQSVAGLRRPDSSGAAVAFGPVLDSTFGPQADLDLLRREATRLAGQRLLDGLPRFLPAVSRVSDVLRNNRVEGLALGFGTVWRGAIGEEARVTVSYGVGDRRLKGKIETVIRLGAPTLRLIAERNVLDVGDFAATSGLVNSIAAQEFGRDLGDYVLRERLGAEFRSAGARGAWGLGVEWEHPQSVGVVARPARGEYRPNPALGSERRVVVRARWERSTDRLTGSSARWRVTGEAGSGADPYGRVLLEGEAADPATGLAIRGAAGLASGRVPVWRSFAVGGAGTLLGQPYRAFGGRAVGWMAAEWLVPVQALALSVGTFGKTGREIRVGPTVAAGWAGGQVAGAPWSPTGRLRVAAGSAVELFDRAFRIAVARGLGTGGRWGLTVDLARIFWPIL